jgi:hypothetical protein
MLSGIETDDTLSIKILGAGLLGLFGSWNLSVFPLGRLLQLSSMPVGACANSGNLRSVLISGSVFEVCNNRNAILLFQKAIVHIPDSVSDYTLG